LTDAHNEAATRNAIAERIRKAHVSGSQPAWSVTLGFDPKEPDQKPRMSEIAEAVARGIVDGPDWRLDAIGQDGSPIASALPLDEARSDSAEQVWLQYDFGTDGVGDCEGWERTIPGEEWTRRVYLESDVQDVDEDSEAATLTIVFEKGSARISEVYAIDSRGNVFGSIELVKSPA
jgi:hypothetical protein